MVGGGSSLPMGTRCPWVGHRCPWLRHGCGGRGVVVCRGGFLVVRVCWSCVVTLRKSSSTWHTGWVCHVNVLCVSLLPLGACCSLVAGHRCLWTGHRCGGWGVVVHGVVGVVPLLCGRGFVVLRKPSWTWHTRMGVPRQPLGSGRRCCPSSFLGSWAFVVESVVVDMAHPDGHATSAVWWWVSWSVSASLTSLTMSTSWAWVSPGVVVAMTEAWDGGG